MSRVETLIVALTATFFMSVAANAMPVRVNVNGMDWDVDIVTGTFEDLEAELESQVWFGGDIAASMLAGEFAAAVGDFFGFPNNFSGDDQGPYFVFADLGPSFQARFVDTSLVTGTRIADIDADFTFATASLVPVPLPAAGLLIVGGLAAIAGLRLGRKRSA